MAACVGDDEVAAMEVSFELVEYLEDTRESVYEAATLWQAALYGRTGRADRAMLLLPVVTERMGRTTAPNVGDSRRRSGGDAEIDFFASRMRCQYLLDQGRFAVAWAASLLLEEGCQEMFRTQRERMEASRAAALTRLRIAAAWYASAEGSEDGEVGEREAGADDSETTMAWLEKSAIGILESRFPANVSHSLIRLDAVAPTLIQMPQEDGGPPPRREALKEAEEEAEEEAEVEAEGEAEVGAEDDDSPEADDPDEDAAEEVEPAPKRA
jgi:hypothetical protein